MQINHSSLFWYARKPEDASNITSGQEHVQEEEILESDGEDEANKVAQTMTDT